MTVNESMAAASVVIPKDGPPKRADIVHEKACLGVGEKHVHVACPSRLPAFSRNGEPTSHEALPRPVSSWGRRTTFSASRGSDDASRSNPVRHAALWAVE